MKFESKVDVWFVFLVFLLVLVTVLLAIGCFFSHQLILLVATVVFVLLDGLLLLPIAFNTYYEFEAEALHIQCGLFINQRIPYRAIVRFFETKNPISSPALSLDRLEIRYWQKNRAAFAVISPKKKPEFIAQLRARIKE